MTICNDMNKENRQKIERAAWGLILALGVTVFILGTLVLSGGCTRTVYKPVETVRTEYIHGDTAQFMALVNSLKEQISQKNSKKESLIHKEKETVKLNEKGDTVLRDRFVYIHLSSEERSAYERTIESQRDSISELWQKLSSVKSDSIHVPYPIEKELTKWEQVKMDFGGMAMGAMAIVVCVAVIWLIRKFRK